MKISELLEQLGELQGLHGDIDVKVFVLSRKRKPEVAAVGYVGVLYSDEAHTVVNSLLVGP